MIIKKVLYANNFGFFLIFFFIGGIILISGLKTLSLSQIRLIIISALIVSSIVFYKTSLEIVAKVVKLV